MCGMGLYSSVQVAGWAADPFCAWALLPPHLRLSQSLCCDRMGSTASLCLLALLPVAAAPWDHCQKGGGATLSLAHL